MSKVLVTGGAGFIGSHLVDKLVELGHHVVIIDSLSRGLLSNISKHIENKNVTFHDSDIRYRDAVDEAMNGAKYVFHLAATNINRSVIYPEESFDINFKGSQVVFKSALEYNVEKVIFASSASVYGEPESLPMSEDDSLNPITPYCVSKLASEHLLRFYNQRHNLKSVSFRNFNVFGTRQNTDAYYTTVIIKFVERILTGQPPIILGGGNQSMDFIHVSDIVNANIMAMNSKVNFDIINLGSGTSTTIADLANMIIKACGVNMSPIFEDRDVFVTRRQADVSKAKSILGFEAKANFETCLSEIVKEISSKFNV